VQFAYTAFDADGRLERGVVDALDAREAEAWVNAHHFGCLAVKPVRPPLWRGAWAGSDRISPVDVAFFFQQVAAMLGVGVSIHRALLNQAETLKPRRLRQVVQDVADRVARGQRVSDGLALYPQIFPPVVTRILWGAEEVGRLELGFQEAGQYVLSGYLLLKKVLGALYYPAAALILLVGAGYFMVYKVFPVLATMYTAFDVKLPAMTVAMIALTHASLRWGPWIGGALAAGAAGAIAWVRRPRGRRWLDRVRLRLPVLGPVFQLSAVTRFLRTLRLALLAALPLEEGLTLAAQATDNRHMAAELAVVIPGIAAGRGLAGPLRETGLFPALVTQGLQIGEDTGTLDDSLTHLLAYYDDELDRRIKGLAEALNPILTGIAAVGVGLLMAATLLPMYAIYGEIKP